MTEASSEALDSFGLETPFAEAGEAEAERDAGRSLAGFGESPFAQAFDAGETQQEGNMSDQRLLETGEALESYENPVGAGERWSDESLAWLDVEAPGETETEGGWSEAVSGEGAYPEALETLEQLEGFDGWQGNAEAELGECEASYEEGSAAHEWLEAEEDAGTSESLAEFAERLGREWSSRRGGTPSPEALRDWLLSDHRDTQEGARLRWGAKFGRGRLTAEAVSRAWMNSRDEQMRFQTASRTGVKPLRNFAPPPRSVALVSDPLVSESKSAPVAPIMVQFVRELRRRFPGGVEASNYPGHGGGSFNGRGYSLDLFLKERDPRGFYPRQKAIDLLRAVNGAARAVRAQWRIIYNDFGVAEAINRETGQTNVIFMGTVRRNKAKRVTGLNWHGPEPLILHFHLDLSPLPGAGEGEAESFGASGWSEYSGEAEQFEPEALEGGWTEYAGEGEGEGEERERFGDFEDERDAEWEAGEQEAETEGEVSLAASGFTPAEKKAVEITSTLETGKRGGFYGLAGNFDGQGLSFGLVNWTIGTGSLQPLLRDFAAEQPARWAAVFGPDAARFLQIMSPKTEAARKEQHRFAIEQMNSCSLVKGKKKWAIREPWVTYFKRLSEDVAFQQIQVGYVRNLLARGDYFCRYFKLKSEQAFAFMFDAVSSHGKWWLTKKFDGKEKRRILLEPLLKALAGRYGEGKVPESEILLAIADVLASTSAPRWAQKVRDRKRWFVTGQHPRAAELHGLTPRPDVPYSTLAGSTPASAPAPASAPPMPVPSPPSPAPAGKRLTPAQFVAAFGASARASQTANGVPALVTLGQAALESGWGQHAPRFNFFGIKAKGSEPEPARQLLRTREVFPDRSRKFPEIISITPRADGKFDYVVKDWFRAFPDAAAAFNGHGEFLVHNKRYAKAFAVASDPYAFAAQVARAGYATAPTYEATLIKVMRTIEAAGGP